LQYIGKYASMERATSMTKFWYRKCVRHSSNVFLETIKTGATFLCIGQVDFPSFLVHFE
ncbi:hypothetical protein T01_7624, partial [Trichinella spiralis]